MAGQNTSLWIYQNNTCTFMKGMYLFIVLLRQPGSTTPHGSARLPCRAKYPMPMVPPGISGCQAGWGSTGLADSKTGSMRCLFCQAAACCGKAIWVVRFRTDALCLARMRHRYYMTGPRSARRWKSNGRVGSQLITSLYVELFLFY